MKMLPHVWQKVGLGLLAVSLLPLILCLPAILHDLVLFDSSYGSDSFGHVWASTLFVSCFVLGTFLMAVSYETQEDERIADIRKASLIRTVFLYLLISFLCLLSNLILPRSLDVKTLSQVMLIRRYFVCVPAFILYYILIFKVSLWIDNKRSDHEE